MIDGSFQASCAFQNLEAKIECWCSWRLSMWVRPYDLGKQNHMDLGAPNVQTPLIMIGLNSSLKCLDLSFCQRNRSGHNF